MSAPSLKRNAAYNVASTVLPLGIALVTTPYLLRALGDARFGVIALVWLLFNYFGLFDMGLSQATSNRLARPGNGAEERQATIVWTALATNAFFGAVGGCAFYLLSGPIFARLASIPPEFAGELKASYGWMACLVPITTINSVFSGVLESRERFGELNSWQTAGSVAGQLGPIIAIQLFGPRLDVALASIVCIRLIFMLPVLWSALRLIHFRWSTPRAVVVRDLLSYGGWVTATNLISPILVSADQFMIASLLGVAAVPLYSIPFTLVSKILIASGALSRAAFPRLSKSGPAEAREKAASVMRLTGWGLALICVPAMLLVEPSLRLWLGDRFSEQSSLVSRVLLIGIWLNGIAAVPNVLLLSQGRPDLPAKLHWMEVLPYLATLWVCVHSFGLVGAAVAWSLRAVVDGVCLLWRAELAKLALRAFALPAAAILACFAVATSTPMSPLVCLASAVVSSIAMLTLAYVEEPGIRSALSLARARF